MLALHGFTGSARDFSLLVDATREELSWVAPDLPGHGTQARELTESAFSFEAIFDELDRILATLPRPPLLLGYSMGGRLALSWVLRRKPALQQLVLVGTHPGIRAPGERRQRRQADRRLAARIRLIGARAFADEWECHPLIRSQQRIPEPWRSQMQERRRRSLPEGLALSLEHTGTGSLPPLWDELPRLSVPCSLVAGEEDSKFSQLNEAFHRQVPDTRAIRLPGAGHCAHLEQAASFADHLLACVRAPRASSRASTARPASGS